MTTTYKVTAITWTGTVNTRYGDKAKSTIKVEGWPEELDYWGQTFVGDNIEGEIKPAKDPKYKAELKKPSKKAPAAPTNNDMISEHMGRKEMSVNNAMERKEKAIAHAGAITNATHLVKAMMEARILAESQLADIKGTVREYIKFYKVLYESDGLTDKEIDTMLADIPF